MKLRLSALAPLAALALGACSDSPRTLTAPSPSRDLLATSRGGDRLATIEWEGRNPRLYLQDLDGNNRVRVSFAHVSDHVRGNYSPRQLPVTDESLMRITRVKWSPDGRYLAVVVAPSTEALQVVLVTADGRALRTVSPNSQYLWGGVEWSPDGKRIAYFMATGPYGMNPEVFITELGVDQVTRVTTGSKVSGYDALRFDASGSRILFTERLGWADDEINSLSRLASVDLASGVVTRGDTVVGEPQGIAHDGSFALFMRTGVVAPYARELIRVPANGSRPTVLASGDLGGLDMIDNDQEAVLTSWTDNGQAFEVIGLSTPGDIRGKLGTTSAATWASVWRTR